MTKQKEPDKWEYSVIWKYTILLGTTILNMPYGGTIRYIDVQNNLPCIWVEFNQGETNRETRRFEVFATGEPIYRGKIKDYVGSFTLIDGAFVGHIYELE